MNGSLTCTTNPSQSGSGSNGNEEVLHIPEKLKKLEPHHQMLFSVIPRTVIGGERGVLPL